MKRLACLTFVAALAALAPGAAYGAFVNYAGRTSQDQHIQFKATKKRVYDFFLTVQAPCTNGVTQRTETSATPAKVDGRGRFVTKRPRHGGSVIRGVIKGRKASGTFDYKVTVNGVTCQTGKQTWTAKISR